MNTELLLCDEEKPLSGRCRGKNAPGFKVLRCETAYAINNTIYVYIYIYMLAKGLGGMICLYVIAILLEIATCYVVEIW